MSRNGVIGALVAASAVIGLAIAGFYWYQGKRYVLTDDATVSGYPVVASAQTLGKIAEMSASVGQRVAKGQVLVRLEDSSLLAEERQAEAGVEAASQAAALAKATLDQAEADLSRASIQAKDGIIPAAQYQDAKSAAEAARVSYRIALAQGQLERARLDAVRTSLSKMVITSPVDGVVAMKWRSVGDVVSPTQPIYALYDLKDLWVSAKIKETEINQLRVGDPVTFSVDSLPGRAFHGSVETIEPGTVAALASLGGWSTASANFSKETQRIPVRIAIDGMGPTTTAGDAANSAPMLPGMSAKVRVSIAQ